ncbi:MAG: type II secretion system protein N [Bdellovibrionota bacterium]
MIKDKKSISSIFTSDFMQELKKFLLARKNIAFKVFAVFLASYGAAAIASSLLVNLLMGQIIDSSKKASVRVNSSPSSVSMRKSDSINYVTMRRAVLERNIFNSTGEFPDETVPEDDQQDKGKKVFDPHAKCQKSSLNLSLLGTIFLGSETTSLATLKESGYSDADIYKAGDYIIGNDEAQVVAVLRKRVVINNQGVKECIEIEEKEVGTSSLSYDPSVVANKSSDPFNNQSKPLGAETDGGCVTLTGTFVEGELGEGFSKVITSARLVPNMENNAVSGFKIFAINKSSLFGKVGFKDGDIITQVNDVSLKQPEQGFALYEAFQNEREINIHVMRGGKTPQTLCVRIK